MRRLALSLGLAASLCASAQLLPPQPEPPSGWTPKTLAHARRYMVAAAHPLAVDAGVRMLEQGGSAVDAMIATQLVLNLVEPSSSGLGGGSFLLYYDAKARAVRAIDGRESAPAGASPNAFLRPDGKPMTLAEARVGGLSVGIPGTGRTLEVAHARYGKLPWKQLFQPAIELAEHGFTLSPRQARLASQDQGLAAEPTVEGYLFAGGKAIPAGTRVRNAPLAAALREIAEHGMDAFYRGAIARDIVEAVRKHRNAGTLALEDLETYRVRDVEPVCGTYRRYRLCGMPPSSSGGIAVLQILGILEARDMAAVRPGSSEAVHLVSEAERLAFADRNHFVADDRFVKVPTPGLLDREYLHGRAALIRPERSLGHAKPGTPAGAPALADVPVEESIGTSHVSIVDGEGSAIAFTTSIESFFGSRVMAHGFFLNNTLTDFNFLPVEDGIAAANALAPGKRPRSAMAPFLVFDRDSGELLSTLGSPGGSFIIGYVAKALLGVLDWKLDIQSAIDLPNFGSRNGPTELEKGTALEGLQGALKAMGHDVRVIDMTSGLQGIRRVKDGWEGGADPRREGVARGR